MLKTVSSVANAIGALNYKGTWNATTNTPTLASGVGTQGDYYVVSVAGTTNLDGITNWGIGDWVTFNGSVWQRVEGGADGNFVNLDVIGDLTVDTNSLYVNSSGNEVCIGQLTSINAGKFNVKGDSAHNGISATPYADTYYNYYGTNAAGGSTFYVRGDGISNFQGAMTVEAQLNNTGNHVITNGNVVVSSGYGIDFSATAGTGTSELLDDYEEGVHTATIVGSTGGSASLASSANELAYTKLGNIVHVSGYLYITATTMTGNARISLPFTAADLPDEAASSPASLWATGSVSINVSDFLGKVGDANNYLEINTGAGTNVGLSAAQFQAGMQVHISLTYKVA
jgi:hypothetical protein